MLTSPRVSFAPRLVGCLCVAAMSALLGCSVDRAGRGGLDAGSNPPDAQPRDGALDLGTDARLCLPDTVDLDGDPANGCECHVAAEICNGRDDDCDPATVDGSSDPSLGGVCDGVDRDLCAEGAFRCEAGVRVCGDTSPDSRETCGNGADDDCDGAIDEPDDAVDTRVFYADADADGHAIGAGSVRACSAPPGFIAGPVDDCDDTRASVYTGAIETCDGRDNDCNATIDDGDAACPCTFRRRATHVYLFCATSWTFAMAETGCIASGYHLATIDDAAESTWMQDTARADATSRQWWIGLTDAATESTFVWTSGSASTFRRWRSGEPSNSSGDEDCAEINAWNEDAWNDSPCTEGNYFVCEAW